MARRVFKYPVEIGAFALDLPEGATVLHVAEQGGVPQMWALVDVDRKVRRYEFVVHGTGHRVGDDESWVATWQSPPFVWHLFQGVATRPVPIGR